MKSRWCKNSHTVRMGRDGKGVEEEKENRGFDPWSFSPLLATGVIPSFPTL